jgi:hypothetical protein
MEKSQSNLAIKLLSNPSPTYSDMLNLANDINEAFLEPQQQFDPLDQSYKVHTVDSQVPNISPEETAALLRSTNISKAGGPDNIPNWILREYSYELALPVNMIINSSIAEGSLPTIWKLANVVPLPKKSKLDDITADLRSISLTPTLSKCPIFLPTDHTNMWMILLPTKLPGKILPAKRKPLLMK